MSAVSLCLRQTQFLMRCALSATTPWQLNFPSLILRSGELRLVGRKDQLVLAGATAPGFRAQVQPLMEEYQEGPGAKLFEGITCVPTLNSDACTTMSTCGTSLEPW